MDYSYKLIRSEVDFKRVSYTIEEILIDSTEKSSERIAGDILKTVKKILPKELKKYLKESAESFVDASNSDLLFNEIKEYLDFSDSIFLGIPSKDDIHEITECFEHLVEEYELS